MTMQSLRILALPKDLPAGLLESSALRATVVQGLSPHARECGPYGLQTWAESRGHALYYVDNCWVRARVRGADVAAFLTDVLKGVAPLDPDIRPDGQYLIEAEEY